MKTRRGFTLVELLVAMVVAVLVVAATGVALHAAFAAWARLSSGAQPLLETTRALARLERDIASALPMSGTALVGDPAACELVRLTVPQGGRAGAPVRVRWSYEAATSAVLREENLLETSTGGTVETPPRTERFRPVAPLRFHYAARAGHASVPLAWQEAWSPPEATNLPAVVRVEAGGVRRLLPCRGARP